MPPKTTEEWVEEFEKSYMEVWAKGVEPVLHVTDWLRTCITTLRKETEEAYQQGKENAFASAAKIVTELL